MSYPKSILTYHIPSEADIDKSMLESHGITVYLMNANVARAEFGAPFHIQLQVPADQVTEAISILRELRPERFGSPAVVKEIEAGLVRGFAQFAVAAAVCTAIVFIFFIRDLPIEQRAIISLINGVMFGALVWILYACLKPKRKRG